MKKVYEFGNEYVCRNFWCADRNCGGVSVSENDEILGEIIGLSVPDEDDTDENKKFDNAVINWIVDNEF